MPVMLTARCTAAMGSRGRDVTIRERRRRFHTGLLGEAPGAVWRVFSRAGIDVEHKKKVDLGVLRGAECHGHVPAPPFSTVDRVCVKQVSSLR